MLHFKEILITLLWGLLVFTVQAQCPDFTDLTGPNVVCYYGTTDNPNAQTGMIPGRHTIITEQGTDPRTDNLLPLLPDGENAVVKLGNELVGAEAESIVYSFTVDNENSILLLKFAVVFENPGHVPPHQPRFVMQVLDANDNLLDPCMEYDVYASDEIPGFQAFGDVKWRPWTNTGFDLSPYIGQTVKVSFTTYDCAESGHFGYAYFTASCISNRLELVGCDGNDVTLAAPQGFESYQWNNGSNTATTTYTVQGTTIANCLVTSVIGCQFMLIGTLTNENIPTQDQTFYDTICEGESYSANGFDLPSDLTPGLHTVFNTYFNIATCTDDITNTLYLMVTQRYFHYYDMACEGNDYNEYGFSYTNLPVGTITGSNTVVNPDGCDSVAILHLSVSPSFTLPNTISGPSVICSQSMATYSISDAEGITYHWNVPDGVSIFSGQGTNTVSLFFSPNAPANSIITLMGANGCGSGSAQLSVTVKPSYHIFANDTMCTGNDYHGNGFQLGVQDSAGIFVYTLNDTTTCGCDSIHVLQLMVAETPVINAVADPAVLCVGQETELHAIGAQASVTLSSELNNVVVGDIWCTDSSCVHLADWPCGKVAMGVVFYVDNTGQHGWAVSLQDEPTTYIWGLLLSLNTPDIPTLTNYETAFTALGDLGGYQNTASIRASGTAYQYPAAYQVDFDHGWHLPAAAQLYRLYATLGIVNNSLQTVGGVPFPMNAEWSYWSSTESSSYEAWALYNSTSLTLVNKSSSLSVRTIRDF